LSWSSGGKNSFEKRADCTHVDEDEHDSFDATVTLDGSTVGENRNPIGQVTRAYSGGSFTVTGREYYHYKYTTHCRGPEWEQTQENDGESRDQGGGNLGARGELSQCWAVLNEKTGIAQLFCRLLTERRSRGVGDKEENVPWKTSFLIPGDPKDGWGSVGSVYSKSERDGDTIRFGGSFDLPTEGPWMGSHGRAAAANGLGKGLNGPDWKPAPEFEVLSSQISQLSQPYPAPRREKSKESPEYGFRGPWPGNLHVEWDVRTNPVEAIVADSFEAKRGEKLEIDGSKSKGENLRYQWTFAPRCQKDSATPNPGAKKTERAINPVFLCDTDVTLEVTDGKAKDKKITHVKIVPRPGWKTDFRGDIADGSLAMSPLTATNAPFLAALGTNACALDEPAGEHILHPGPPRNEGPDSYRLKQVADPDGPFDGKWYVDSLKLVIARKLIITQDLLPIGLHFATGPVAGAIWYHNQASGHAGDVKMLFDEIVAHEKLHTVLMEDALKAPDGDPVPVVEKKTADTKEWLTALVQSTIGDAEMRLCEATSERKVKARLGAGRFAIGGVVELPVERGSTEWAPWNIESFAGLGSDGSCD